MNGRVNSKPKQKIKQMVRRKAGFSIIELLISMASMSVIATVIVMVYVSSQRGFITGIARMDIDRNLRQANELLRKDIKSAVEITNYRTINGFNYMTFDWELILKIPSINAAGDTIADTFDYVVYHRNWMVPGQLERLVDADAASARTSHRKVIANSINNVLFSSAGLGMTAYNGVFGGIETIDVNLTGQRTVLGSQTLQSTVQLSITMRNREV